MNFKLLNSHSYEKSKIPFSYMLYAYSVKEPIGELNLKRAFGWGYRSLFFLLLSSSPLGQTAVSGNFTLHQWSWESLSFLYLDLLWILGTSHLLHSSEDHKPHMIKSEIVRNWVVKWIMVYLITMEIHNAHTFTGIDTTSLSYPFSSCILKFTFFLVPKRETERDRERLVTISSVVSKKGRE